ATKNDSKPMFSASWAIAPGSPDWSVKKASTPIFIAAPPPPDYRIARGQSTRSLLGLQIHLALAGLGIDGYRDMRMHNLPLALNLVEHVGDANRGLGRLVVLILPGEMLETAGHSQLAVGDDFQFDEFAFDVLRIAE